MVSPVKKTFAPWSDRDLEAYLLKELPPARAAALERDCETSTALKAHLDGRRREREEFYQRHPSLELEASKDRSAKAGWFPRRWLLAGASAALVVFLALWVAMVLPDNDDPGSGLGQNDVRAKGALQASFTVQRQQRIFEYRDGVLLRPGDRLMITVQSSQAGYLSLIGRDRKGQTSIYYDAVPTTAGSFTMDQSLVLDEDRHTETWLVLLSSSPVPAAEHARNWLAQQALDGQATVFLMEKEISP